MAWSQRTLLMAAFRLLAVHSLPTSETGSAIATLSVDRSSHIQTGAEITQTPPSIQPGATKPDTTGTVFTSLETSGHPASQPFPTETVTSPTKQLTTPIGTFISITFPEGSSFSAKSHSIPRPGVVMAAQVDPFQALSNDAPPSSVPSRDDHPVPRLNIAQQGNPLPTNKFYANLFLGNQSQSVFAEPYTLAWGKGGGNSMSWGIAISHVDVDQYALGDPQQNIPGSPVRFYVNPVGLQSIVLSAAEIGEQSVVTTDNLKTFSVNANLRTGPGASSGIAFPLVQGMAFVTGVYTNVRPQLNSGIYFKSAVDATSPKTGVFKYQITLEDGKAWLVYVIPKDGQDPKFELVSNTLFQGPIGWSGTIQVARNPTGDESAFDDACGVYPTSAALTGAVTGNSGSYTLTWTKAGLSTDQKLLMYALPHHLDSFDSSTAQGKTNVTLQSTTKGLACAVIGDSWTINEPNLPTDMGFAPWTPSGTKTQYSAEAVTAIMAAASNEVKQDMNAQSNLNSMYYAGKALSKFASIIWAINDIGGQKDLAQQGLDQLKVAFARFVTNQQQFPLAYDTAWKGAVSSASYGGDSGADFGNTYYNDHHFHYGYFIHAAAIIGYLDKTWLDDNKAWVNMLVRDVSNPSADDTYFPVFRSFDWYHGHSWAKGLFESGDGKDEESSSEDVMFAYSLKMWGNTIGDASMEARGNLMLSVLARSLQAYFLLKSDNKNQPSNFIGNKVTGIMFENKVDHVTYFGSNPEYVQGIHMIPLVPASALTRTKGFVQEEWDTYFSESAFNPASKVVGGWKGILYANLALIDPVSSWKFFSDPGFDPAVLDGGASKTWYLVYAAGLGGA